MDKKYDPQLAMIYIIIFYAVMYIPACEMKEWDENRELFRSILKRFRTVAQS